MANSLPIQPMPEFCPDADIGASLAARWKTWLTEFEMFLTASGITRGALGGTRTRKPGRKFGKTRKPANKNSKIPKSALCNQILQLLKVVIVILCYFYFTVFLPLPTKNATPNDEQRS
jgi:hypothetical protein